MKTCFSLILTVIILVGAYLVFVRQDPVQTHSAVPNPLHSQERRDLSYALADLLWENLANYAPHYDLELVLERLQALSEQKVTRRTSREYHDVLLAVLEKTTLDRAKADLQKTELLLNDIQRKPGVTEVIQGKLYYEQVQAGDGPVVSLDSSPTLHYTESTVNGLVRSSRSKNVPIKVSLKDTLKGFCLGVAGMRVGEKRKIYVHPDLAYGKLVDGAPQELVTFEVEVLAL